jgi:cysteine desulfurase
MAEARERISLSLFARDSEQLVLTSSGTEANQLAIRSVLGNALTQERRPQGPRLRGPWHWITTPIEHDSVLQLVPWFREQGGEVSFLPVDSEGRVDAQRLAALWRPETALVSVNWVNNETGVIADLAAISTEVRRLGGVLHVDAAQAWGKLPIEIEKQGAHSVSFSAHKIGGFAGTGVLWVAKGHRIAPVLLGKQEKGRRGGTENVIGAIAVGRAASELDPQAWAARVAPLRDELQNAICQRIPDTRVNGGGAPRVANTLNLSFDGIEGDGLVMALDLAGYSVSSGSACSSGALEPSHVLLAMGRTRAQAMAALRISLADVVEREAINGFVQALSQVVQRMRNAKLKVNRPSEHDDLQQAAD